MRTAGAALSGGCVSGALPGTQLALGPGAFGRGEDRVRDAEAGVIPVRACAGGCQAAGAALRVWSSAGTGGRAGGFRGAGLGDARRSCEPSRRSGERKLCEGMRGIRRDSSDWGISVRAGGGAVRLQESTHPRAQGTQESQDLLTPGSGEGLRSSAALRERAQRAQGAPGEIRGTEERGR